MAGCVFCGIVAGEIPSALLHRDPDAVAFDDLNPQAPAHFLVVPVRHIETVSRIEDPALLAHLFSVAHRVAAAKGVAESGYRLVFNQGADAGQTVYHVHLHVLGGRSMGWPPG